MSYKFDNLIADSNSHRGRRQGNNNMNGKIIRKTLETATVDANVTREARKAHAAIKTFSFIKAFSETCESSDSYSERENVTFHSV